MVAVVIFIDFEFSNLISILCKNIYSILNYFYSRGDDSNNLVPSYYIQRGLECILLHLLLLVQTTCLTQGFDTITVLRQSAPSPE